ncbi:DNA-binding response regulator [Candidatus Epulonipiscium fishelsonii]|uniref:DNA-binding response regulator n=1 Tax=Candidatus Epulonipiscium fishelsonii TaxID=77094 RepID=A0ACC8X7N6_9FIRM|nr:DNA-binding response regulator [Epulopiscium sp. SCG-B11WGA-EpuloA1]ONI41463.1 DNA-binding response regulator [Epulopiscium sp. SCG-B05WGA-EpuloA1]
MYMQKIIIIEDEKTISDIIKYNLEKEGYSVYTAYDGISGLETIENINPDLILLDIMMPKMDGLEVCKRVRQTSDTPIIMLTAKAEEIDKVVGLEIGADDYITKPFGMRELIARVKANLRRFNIPEILVEDNKTITEGDLELNLEKYEVLKKGKVIDLTVREFELLKFLVKQKGKIFSRETLLEKVWGYEYYGDVRTVDVTIRRLREKIEDEPSRAAYVLTKRGVGYYFRG